MPVSTSHTPVPSILTVIDTVVSFVVRDTVAIRGGRVGSLGGIIGMVTDGDDADDGEGEGEGEDDETASMETLQC